MASKTSSLTNSLLHQSDWVAAVQAGLDQREHELLPDAMERVGQYFFWLDQWNQRMNLTAYRSLDEWIDFHLLDAMAMLRVHEWMQERPLVDIGSGAGVPGLLFACLNPGWPITMIESVGKKSRFIQHCIDEIGLSNARVFANRAEELAHDAVHRDTYATATARALASLSMSLELCSGFVSDGGEVLLTRGERESDEDRFGESLGLSLAEVKAYQLSGRDNPFFLYHYIKEASGLGEYPRRANQMKNKPL